MLKYCIFWPLRHKFALVKNDFINPRLLKLCIPQFANGLHQLHTARNVFYSTQRDVRVESALIRDESKGCEGVNHFYVE